MASFSKFLESFNDDNSKGKQFEGFVKWFLENDPEWQTQVDKVWLWDKYPNRWGRDDGIDLIFRHKNGETWAVQAKCYDQKYAVTKKDMDSFFSESSRPEIDRRLLMASTDNIGTKVKKLCLAQEKPVTLFLHSDFTKSQIEYPEHIKDLKKAKRKELPKPRDHQAAAIKDVVKGFKTEDRGQMIMACGTGKTFTTLWVKEELKPKTSLVLLPSLSLLSQTLREWTGAATKPFEALCVCSDASVGKASDDELSESLADVSFPTTSNPEEIKKFLERDVDKVIFSTYHSSPQVAEAHQINKELEFDLIISDEAHRSTGEAGKAFTTALDNDLIRSKKRLFTTATPRTYAPHLKKKASESGVEIADMSDETIFGKVFHNLTFGQAIESELLTDYQVVIIGVNESMIAEWIESRELVRYEGGEITDAKSLAAQVGVVKAIKDYNINRMITFHSKVSGADNFAKDLNNAIQFVPEEHRPDGDFYTDFVSGKMTSYERNLKLSQLKELPDADRGILTNARCLSEGVDVPSLDGVAFIDPKSSQVDIVQAVGRAIRKSENKTKGTIILPVFIEERDNDAEAIETSRFKHIWQVINALKSHDETLSFQLDQLRTNLGYQGGGYVKDISDKIVFDIPRDVDENFSKSLKTIVVNSTTQAWDFWYGLLKKYTEENGNASPTNEVTINDNLRLGVWVQRQRGFKNKNLLSSEKIEKLETLNGWTWDPAEDKWQANLNMLMEYVEEFGHSRPPNTYQTKEGFELGLWVKSLRAQYKHKKNIPDTKIKILESLNGWTWDAELFSWNLKFEQLQNFYKVNKSLPKEKTKTKKRDESLEEYQLSVWVRNQRKNYKKRSLDSHKVARLEELSFWEWSTEDNWDLYFNDVKKYLLKNEKYPSNRKDYLSPNLKIYDWIIAQRVLYRKNKLLPARVEKLESLKNWVWNSLTKKWDYAFQRLKIYHQKFGNYDVPTEYVDEKDFALGKWVNMKRAGKEALPSYQLKAFESLDGWIWSARGNWWDEAIKEMKIFINSNGNALPAANYISKSGFGLGMWVNKQRTEYNRGKLPAERIDELESLPFWVWDARAENWKNAYEELIKFVEKNNHCKTSNHITEDGFKLGSWVSKQRTNYKKNKISQERIKKLETVRHWHW